VVNQLFVVADPSFDTLLSDGKKMHAKRAKKELFITLGEIAAQIMGFENRGAVAQATDIQCSHPFFLEGLCDVWEEDTGGVMSRVPFRSILLAHNEDRFSRRHGLQWWHLPW
jgi:hypothetical protein